MKNRILILVALLPLLSFCVDFNYPIKVRVSYFSSSGSTDVGYKNPITVYSSDELRSCFYNSTFGIFLQPSFNSILSPTFSNQQSGVFGLLNQQIATNGNHFVLSPLLFPEVSPLFYGVLSLLRSGYSGPGIHEFYRSSAQLAINVNFPVLVSDVLASTNTVFRQIVISSLSSLESSIQNIHVDLGQFQSDYTIVNYDFLNVSNALDSAAARNEISFYQAEQFKSDIANAYSDPSSYGDPVSFSRAVLNGLNNRSFSSDFSGYLNSHPDSLSQFGRSFGDALASGGSGHYITPLTNELQKLNTNWVAQAKAALSNNTEQTKAALSNNTQQIKQQLSHMFDNPADSSTVGGGIANISRAVGTLASTVAGNRIMVSVENNNPVVVRLDGPINIDQSQFNSLSTPIAGLERKISTWYDEWYSFFNLNSPSYSWDKFFDMVSEFKNQNHQDLSALSNAFPVVAISNLLNDIDTKLAYNFPNLTNGNLNVSFSASFGSLLHEDYSNFVEHSFSDILTNLEDQYPGVYDSLQNLGLSDDSYNGRWWNFSSAALSQISVSVHSNMLMLSSLMSDIAAVDDLADESLGKSPLSACRDIIRDMPSKTQIEDYISQCTNAANSVSVAGVDLVSSLDSVSNSYVSIFKPFKGSFDSPGSSVTFFKAANGDYVTIPVGDQSNAWLILRLGISFALVAVNILLLPKYILMLFTLFIKAYRIGIKFFPDDR